MSREIATIVQGFKCLFGMKIGAIRVDSSKLLERGLRRELVLTMEMQKDLWDQKSKVKLRNLRDFYAVYQCSGTFQNK